MALGVTKSGQPRHPGRLAASTPLAPWRWPEKPSAPLGADEEQQVVEHFEAWLIEDGWFIQRGTGWPDVVAERGGRRLVAEAKGATSALGLDIDTGYGQLLRRMDQSDDRTRYGLVVPNELRDAALRVPAEVRSRLRISVYLVGPDGQVTEA